MQSAKIVGLCLYREFKRILWLNIFFFVQRASCYCGNGYVIKCVGLTNEGSAKHTANELA